MLRLHLTARDLAEVRFATSPLWEIVMSSRVLRDAGRHAVHGPWVDEAREALAGTDLSPLTALVPPERKTYVPDFLAPPPKTPWPDFDEELERLRETPPELVRREARRIPSRNPDVEPSPALRAYREDPQRAVERLAGVLEVYWEETLGPHWPRIRALLESEVLRRSRTLAVSGAAGLFEDLHPEVGGPEDGVVEIERSWSGELRPDGEGLLMIPSAFVWPDLYVVADRPWQPAVMYPARGVAWLWMEHPPDRDEQMETLLGEARARVLRSLRSPVTTKEVARRLGVTPSAVSQHLSRLHRAGAVERTRVGRRVYYRLSPRGEAVLDAFDGLSEPAG